MFEINTLNTALFSTLFGLTYYLLVSLYKKRLVRLELRKLLFYVTIFSLFGITGEVFVNTIYDHLFHVPLWEYRIFPAHDGDISYFFIYIWGLLGFYKYINDTALHSFEPKKHLVPGLVMGAEAIVLEILYNGLFLLFFGNYIFYYFPENLSFFSHLSCLQVIPFYFMVGFCVNALINQQNKIGYGRSLIITLPFYWMIIISFVFF